MDKEKEKNEYERLKNLFTYKTEMVSLTAHQVKTSLSGLKWIIKMFLSGDLGKLTEEQENLMQKASESNERAITYVSELLLTNKIEEIIDAKLNIEKIDLLKIIEDTIFDFSGEAHTKGIEIILLKPFLKLNLIKGDKEKVRVILQNILENAIKYSDPHGKIFITIKEIDEFVQTSVKNYGTIISEEGQKKIFEKYYRDKEAMKREEKGTGLGLYTIKGIVDKLNGKIWFESNIGDGTTFFFTLPRFEE